MSEKYLNICSFCTQELHQVFNHRPSFSGDSEFVSAIDNLLLYLCHSVNQNVLKSLERKVLKSSHNCFLESVGVLLTKSELLILNAVDKTV